MKSMRFILRSMSLLFIAGILSSCSAYNFAVTPYEAAQVQRKVKVVQDTESTLRPESQIYDYLQLENGIYYGVRIQQGDTLKTRIDPADISQVYLRKAGMPTWAVVLLSAAAGAVLLIGIAFIGYASGW